MGAESKYEVSLPEVTVTDDVMKKIEVLSEYEHEVGGWLTGKVENKKLYVDGILIPKQEVSSSEVDIKEGDILELIKEFGSETCNRIIGHLHTHNTMGAFWSNTDEDNMKKLIAPRNLFLFIVTSYKDGETETLVRLSINSPVSFYIDGINLHVEDGDDKAKLRKELDAEIEKKVKVTKYVTYTTGYENYGQTTLGTRSLDLAMTMPMITWRGKGKFEVYVDGIEQNDLESVRSVVDEVMTENIAAGLKTEAIETLKKDGTIKLTLTCENKKQAKDNKRMIEEALIPYYEELGELAQSEGGLTQGGLDYGRAYPEYRY